LGLSHDAIKRRVAAGRLHRIHRGAYAVGHRNLTQHGIWLAAVLACGLNAALSHESAAQLSRILPLPDYRGPTHVTVMGTNGIRQRRGIVVHRSRTLGPADIQLRDGIPVTKPARTLEDLHRALPLAEWEDALDRARFLSLPIGDLRASDPLSPPPASEA
jgi:hypothetical protein